MPLLPPICRAIFFDAVGTLLHPEPAAGAVYAEAGRRFGSRLAPEVISARFRIAFGRQQEQDRAANQRTDEARELARWRAIVGEVLDDVADPRGCFAFLYEHFSRPVAWRVEPEVTAVLHELDARGLVLGLASNFDHRLRGVVAGLAELRWLRHLIISSEVGWRKPAPAFFAAACRAVHLPPGEVLFVGDDRANDYEGALAAGLSTLLFDPQNRAKSASRISRFEELLAVPALAGLMQDPKEDVRMGAADALAKIGPDAKEGVPALTAALKDKSDMVWLEAAKALGAIGPDARTAVPALKVAAAKDEEEAVQKAAQDAIEKIQPPKQEN